MTKIKCKGTALKTGVAGSAYVTLAQVISLTLPTMESETYESDTLDNALAGIPYDTTGRTEGGTLSGEMFFDPALAAHQTLLALLTTPDGSAYWRIAFADAAVTLWTFGGAGFSFGGTVALNDGLKGSFSVKLDGLPTFP